MTSSPHWLERYRDGDRDVVWHELRQLGARVREPAFAAEAQAVCDEMAMRAHHNIEVIVDRLTMQGYRFHENDFEQAAVAPWSGPDAEAEELLQWLDDRFGPVPMTLSSWIRIVGDVWLVGTHPEWPGSAAGDPLVIETCGTRYDGFDIRAHFEDEFEQWSEEPDGEPFQLPVAPDRLHKNNVSGGGPYGIVLPDAGADAFMIANVGLPLVFYLRAVFEHGGFPYWTGDDRQGSVGRSLAADLLPI